MTLEYQNRTERDRVQCFRAAASSRQPFNMYFDPATEKLHMRRVDNGRVPQVLPTGCIWIGHYKRPCPAQMFLDDLREVVGVAK